MMFWFLAALLTFLAVLFVVVPLARHETVERDEIEFDKAVYHARVKEIESDRELGRITDEAAKQAIAEEGRKLIALADHGETQASGGKIGSKLAAGIALIAVPLIALGLYLSYGNPGMPDQTLAARMNAAPEQQSIEELVARAEGHLKENPDDARGWAVIAPVYARLGRDEDAVRAWANVLRLAPETPGIKGTLGEAMINASKGVVTDAAQKLFHEELAADQSSAKARFYLAMALGQEGRHKEAIAAWDELIAGGTSQSPWMNAALEFRKQSASAIGDTSVASAPDAPGNPTKEDIAAASEMTTQDRQEMISNMVAGLAEKLKEDPSNKASWQRLIRSYIVLGRTDEAREAISTAQKANDGDAEFTAMLEDFRKMLPAGGGNGAADKGISQ